MSAKDFELAWVLEVGGYFPTYTYRTNKKELVRRVLVGGEAIKSVSLGDSCLSRNKFGPLVASVYGQLFGCK